MILGFWWISSSPARWEEYLVATVDDSLPHEELIFST